MAFTNPPFLYYLTPKVQGNQEITWMKSRYCLHTLPAYAFLMIGLFFPTDAYMSYDEIARVYQAKFDFNLYLWHYMRLIISFHICQEK